MIWTDSMLIVSSMKMLFPSPWEMKTAYINNISSIITKIEWIIVKYAMEWTAATGQYNISFVKPYDILLLFK